MHAARPRSRFPEMENLRPRYFSFLPSYRKRIVRRYNLNENKSRFKAPLSSLQPHIAVREEKP